MIYYDPFAWVFALFLVIIVFIGIITMNEGNTSTRYVDNSAQYMAQIEKERTKQYAIQARTETTNNLIFGGIILGIIGGAGVIIYKFASRPPQTVTNNYTINNAPQLPPPISVPYNRILEAKNDPRFTVYDIGNNIYEVTMLETNTRRLLTTNDN